MLVSSLTVLGIACVDGESPKLVLAFTRSKQSTVQKNARRSMLNYPAHRPPILAECSQKRQIKFGRYDKDPPPQCVQDSSTCLNPQRHKAQFYCISRLVLRIIMNTARACRQ